MSLGEYFEEIESFEFAAQFSVFSGFRLVLLDMDDNETLRKLVLELRADGDNARFLLERIRLLQANPPLEDQIAFDGCLASYLYCLWKSDLEIGYLASQGILNTGDLWWSAKLALLVRNEYLEEQISKKVQFSSDDSALIPYTLTRPEFISLSNIDKYPSYFVIFEPLTDTTSNLKYKGALGNRAKILTHSFGSPFGQLARQDFSCPTQDFEIANVI